MVSAFGSKLRKLEGGQVLFRCPGCRSSHAVGVEDPAPLIWGFNGNGDAPTFTPSIFVNAPGRFHHPGVPSCHSFVTDGRIQFLNDCTHALAGQTVDLPDWEGH